MKIMSELVNDVLRVKRGNNFGFSKYNNDLITFAEVINSAQKSLAMLVSVYDKEFYNDMVIIDKFIDFIENTKGYGRIDFVFEASSEDVIRKKGIVRKLLAYHDRKYGDNGFMRVFKLNDEFKVRLLDYYFPNILVADEKGPYRLELGWNALGSNHFSSTAGFNEQKARDLRLFIDLQIERNAGRII